jgi:hypothetical protein
MTGSIHIAYMLPLYHLAVAMRFFQSSPLGLLTKIYPFIGFESLIEYVLEKTISILAHYVHVMSFPENPLVRFCPLQHVGVEKLPWMNVATFITNTCRVWLPS